MRSANPRGQAGPPLRPPTVIANIATHAMNLSRPVWMRCGYSLSNAWCIIPTGTKRDGETQGDFSILGVRRF
jgi:hypothetical protein